MAKRKKNKTGATAASIATGLAAAAADGLVRATVGRLGKNAKGSSTERDQERPSKKNRKKGSKEAKRLKKAQSRKKGRSAEQAAVELLGELATSARKRLAKLADKLGSVTTKRRALIEELGALQTGITAALQRFGSDSDEAQAIRPKLSKKARARKASTAGRSSSSRKSGKRIDEDVRSDEDRTPVAASEEPEAEDE